MAKAENVQKKQKMIVGISGASGIWYAARLLMLLRALNIETHLVVSKAAQMTRALETDLSQADLVALADNYYPIDDFSAVISSGSFTAMGMIVVPCSVRTVAEIATGVCQNLLTRSADVTLKERGRELVLMVRETPLHAGHLEHLLKLAQLGACIFPPMPSLYTQPKSIHEMIDYTLLRVLDQFGLHLDTLPRWQQLRLKEKSS